MLEEVLYDQPTGRLALVFELMDANLYELIKGRRQYLSPQLIKSYMWQLMKSLDHMHKKGIFHRDIKPENILIESSSDVARGLKLADFGSCRGIYSKQPYTEYISTRWYRAPECLLTDGYYGPEMDLWGAGCVMFEITSLYPLFPGSNEVDQINRIHKIVGTPPPDVLQKLKSKGASHISFDFPEQTGVGIPQLLGHASPECVDLIVKLLKYDAAERMSAREAMRHPYFKDMKEMDAKKALEGTSDAAGAKAGSQENNSAQANNAAPMSISKAPAHALAGPGGIVGGGAQINGQNVSKGLPTLVQGGAAPSNAPVKNAPSSYNMNNFNNNYGAQVSDSNSMYSKNPAKKPVESSAAPSAAAGGSLPPIMGHGAYGVPNSGGAAGAPKKKKKYRVNYGQRSGQHAEQVMKAYGVARNPSSLDSSSKILQSSADLRMDNKPGQGLSQNSVYSNATSKYK